MADRFQKELRKDEQKAERDVFKTLCVTIAGIFVVICIVWSFMGY